MRDAEITDQELARWRLSTQRLVGPKGDDEVDVVGGLLAVQAENHGQASWAVATRTTGLTAATLADRFDAGTILRTHVLRATWHYVLPVDIGWLLALTGPRVRRLFRPHQRALGLDDAAVDRAAAHVVDAIDGGTHLTRAQLGDALADEGMPSEGPGLMVVLAHAELTGAICSGPMRDGQHTYARIDERAPHARHLDRDDALAELTLRYFTGHGPATERDLAYWATLTLTDVRAGLASVADQLDSFDHDGRTYWFALPLPTGPTRRDAHLLQILDEYYRGYQDSRHVLDAAGLAPGGREAAAGMVLVDGQYVGDMRRTLTSHHVAFDVTLRRALDHDEAAALDAEVHRYGTYLALEPTLDTTAPASRSKD